MACLDGIAGELFGECAWVGGVDDHITADLANPSSYELIAAEVRRRLGGAKLAAIINNAAISPKLANGGRKGVSMTAYEEWLSLSTSIFSPQR